MSSVRRPPKPLRVTIPGAPENIKEVLDLFYSQKLR